MNGGEDAADRALIAAAAGAMTHSYAPYSHFRVGAALRTAEGRVYTGCNIENAAFTPTCCAERTALFKAVSEGERNFTAMAVVGGPGGDWKEFCFPCGVCRQVLAEFCGRDFRVIVGTSGGKRRVCTLGELLPEAFGPGDVLGGKEADGYADD